MERVKIFLQKNKINALSSVLVSWLGIALFYLNVRLLGGQLGTTTKFSLVVYSLVMPIILLFLRSRDLRLQRKEKVLSLIMAILISQFVSLGSYADAVDFVSLCFSKTGTAIIWLLQSMIYSYMAFHLVKYVVYILQYGDSSGERGMDTHLNLKKVFWVLFAVNLAFVFILYPCVFDFDGAMGLRTYLNPNDIKSNHHPYFIQMIHGLSWKLGKSIGDPSLGFALLTIIYCFMSTLILTYGISLLSKYDIDKKYMKYILLISPIYLFISHLPTKDGFFAYAYLCYTLTIFDIVLSKRECLKSIGFLIVHFLSILFVCLSRNQGIYIIVAESLVLLFYCRKDIRNILRIASVVFPAIGIILLFTKIFLPSQNVCPSSKKEIFGMLFQQTALYTIRHADDIYEKEAAAINAILPVDKIKEVYTPDITDKVKACYCPIGFPGVTGTIPDESDGMIHFSNKIIDKEGEKLKDYLSAWCSMLVRHPKTYFDAWVAVEYGFTYNKGEMLCMLPTNWPYSEATIPEYSFKQNSKLHNLVNSFFGYAVNIPIVNWLYSIPYYIWLFILILFVLVLRTDKDGLMLILPTVLSLGVLVLCPVCNSRYMYPILVCLPFFVFYVLLTNKKYIR